MERGKEMANKDDEIDKTLNEIKGSKSPEDSKPNSSQTQVREKEQAASAPDNTKREASLEPTLNELPVKKRNTEEYKEPFATGYELLILLIVIFWIISEFIKS